MKNKTIPIIYFFTVLVMTLLQTSFFPQFKLGWVKPDLVLLFVISVGLIRGYKEAVITGALAGLMAGIISWNIWGLYVLAYSLVGFTAGLVPEKVEPDNLIIPLLSGLSGSLQFSLIFALLGPSLELFYPEGIDFYKSLIFAGWNGFLAVPVFLVCRYVLVTSDATWSLR